jgi:type II secretion system protein N
VRKLRRIVWIASGVVIAIVVAVLLGVNLYVQSQGTQAKIQQELSQRLGTTIRIRGASVTPWAGLELTGITIPQAPAPGATNFLEAKTFRLRIRFLSLFSRRLVIREVSLVDPNVSWPQNADGKWRLPGWSEEARQERQTSAKTAPRALETTTPEAEPEREPSPAIANEHLALTTHSSKSASKAFVPEIRWVNVTGGTFRFLDRSGDLVAIFEGVKFRSKVRNAVALNGEAQVRKISLRDSFFLEQLRSSLDYDPKRLDLSQISAHAGGGEVGGRFTIQPQAEDSPFTVSANFRNVQADRIVSEAGGPKGIIQGKLDGSVQASGKTADREALIGSGEIFLREGQLRQYSLLVALGQILQIEELTQLHLEQAQAKYHLNPGFVTIDELILRSPNIRLSAKGTVTFKGRLQLDSQLAINEKIRGQLFKPIRQNFRPTDEPGYFALGFQVGGSIDRPKSNLMENLVGRDLRDLGGVINSLFGAAPSDHPKKKKTASPQPEASAPAPSP